MIELILSAQNTNARSPGNQLLEEIQQNRDRKKVYRTFTGIPDSCCVVLLTASKDTHLQIGALSRKGQASFAEVLYDAFYPHGILQPETNALVFGIIESDSDKNRRNGDLLVTSSHDKDGIVTFHISPTR